MNDMRMNGMNLLRKSCSSKGNVKLKIIRRKNKDYDAKKIESNYLLYFAYKT